MWKRSKHCFSGTWAVLTMCHSSGEKVLYYKPFHLSIIKQSETCYSVLFSTQNLRQFIQRSFYLNKSIHAYNTNVFTSNGIVFEQTLIDCCNDCLGNWCNIFSFMHLNAWLTFHILCGLLINGFEYFLTTYEAIFHSLLISEWVDKTEVSIKEACGILQLWIMTHMLI